MSTLTTAAAMEAAPGLLRSAIDSRITKIRPMSTPIDQISRIAGSKHAGAMEVAYYSVDSKPTETTIAKPVDVESTSPTENLGRLVKIEVDDASVFDKTDTVMFPKVTSSDGSPVVGYVTDVTDSKVSVALPEDCTANLQKGQKMVRMGRAAAELDVQTPQYQSLPKRKTNYCQIFKLQVEQSTLMRLADKEVGWTFSEQEEAAVIDMRLGMEKNFLFGCKRRILDPEKGEFIYLTGGIWDQAAKSITFKVNDPTVDDLITLAKQVFTGNNGSRKRLLVGGSEFVEAVSKIKFSDKVIAGNMHTKWGLETREIITNFGSLYILHSEVFDQCGHASDAFVIDQAFITKYTHIGMRPERLNLRAAGTRNSDAVVLTEASCMVLRNPDVHFRVIGTQS